MQNDVATYLEYVELFLSKEFARSAISEYREPFWWSKMIVLGNGKRLGYVLTLGKTLKPTFRFDLGNGKKSPLIKLELNSPKRDKVVIGNTEFIDMRDYEHAFYSKPDQELKRLKHSLEYIVSFDFYEDGVVENEEMLEKIPSPPSNWETEHWGIKGVRAGFIDFAL